MSDEEKEETKGELQAEAAAHIWARDGEGPHALVPAPRPEATEKVETTALPEPASAPAKNLPKNSSMTDLQDLVVLAGEAQIKDASVAASAEKQGQAQAATRQAEASEPAQKSDQKSGVGTTDGARAAGTSAEAEGSVDNDVGDGSEADDPEADDSEADEEEADEEEADEDEADGEPVSDGTPSKNDIAVGYVIPLALYFVFYLVNVIAGGYCLSSERMNALAELFFYWTPALGALCLLLGAKAVRLTGTILFLPLAGAAVYAGMYFHTYERFETQISINGPLVKAYDANGWRICRYESSWINGNQPGTTYTREKDVAPYVVYTRKMRMGEPP